MSTLDRSAATGAPSTTPIAPPPGSGRQRAALAVLLTAGFTLAVDFSVLAVALPTIGADLGFALADLQWIGTAFALCAAGFTLFFGRIADIVGRRRVFLVGIAALGLSSLAGGLAETPAVLLSARVAQGLATAAVTPAALSLLTTSFPEGPSRARALGLNGALMAAGFTAGSILGGLLTDLLSWRWAFHVNVAVAVLVLAVAPVVLAEDRPERRPRLDVPGAVTVTAALLAIVYGAAQAGQRPWGDPQVWLSLLVGAGLLAVFWIIERGVLEPLVPPRVLHRRTVAFGNIGGALAFLTETSLVFLLTLYLQEVRGFSPLAAGSSFVALGAGTVLGGVLGPRVIGAVGAKVALVAGFVVQAAATAPLVLLGAGGQWLPVLLVATFLGGVANLVAIVGFMVTATSGLPDEDQGLATGLATMSQQIGITMGMPIMSAIATAGIIVPPSATAVLGGIHLAIAVNAALCLGAAVLLAVALPGRPGGTGVRRRGGLARRRPTRPSGGQHSRDTAGARTVVDRTPDRPGAGRRPR